MSVKVVYNWAVSFRLNTGSWRNVVTFLIKIIFHAVFSLEIFFPGVFWEGQGEGGAEQEEEWGGEEKEERKEEERGDGEQEGAGDGHFHL